MNALYALQSKVFITLWAVPSKHNRFCLVVWAASSGSKAEVPIAFLSCWCVCLRMVLAVAES